MIRHLLLDWSGTLCDDRELTRQVTNEVLVAHGAEPVDEATYRRDFVIPIEGFYRPRIGEVPRERIDHEFFDRYAARVGQAPLYPGVALLLELARWRGLRLTCVSTMAQTILDAEQAALGIADLFHRVRGSAADKIPALTEEVAAAGIAPDECLYVGDTAHDLQAAHAAGVRAGAALYGYSLESALRAEAPDYLLHSPGELLDLLERDWLLATERRVIATVGGIVANDAGELLLVRTRKWSGKYGLPGGKIEYGETMLAAYLREIREETGLLLEDARYLMTQDCIEHPEFVYPRHFLLINFFSRLAGRPVLKANYESDEIGWYPLSQLAQMDLNQPTRVALEQARLRGWLEVA